MAYHGRSHLPGGSDPISVGGKDSGFYEIDIFGGGPASSGSSSVFLTVTFAGSGAGVDLLDTTDLGTPDNPVPLERGMYWFEARVQCVASGGTFLTTDNGTLEVALGREPEPNDSWARSWRTPFVFTAATATRYSSAGIIAYMDPNDTSGPGRAYYTIGIQRTTSVGFNVNGEVVVQRIW